MRKNESLPAVIGGLLSITSTCGLLIGIIGQITVKYILRGGAIGFA